MDIDYIVVALEKGYAREKGLPDSANFPWDPTYSAYMISSLHSLHCLVSCRSSENLAHCLTLRLVEIATPIEFGIS
jgi:hypothetical protein